MVLGENPKRAGSTAPRNIIHTLPIAVLIKSSVGGVIYSTEKFEGADEIDARASKTWDSPCLTSSVQNHFLFRSFDLMRREGGPLIKEVFRSILLNFWC